MVLLMQITQVRGRNPNALHAGLGKVVRLKTRPLPGSVRKHKTHGMDVCAAPVRGKGSSMFCRRQIQNTRKKWPGPLLSHRA